MLDAHRLQTNLRVPVDGTRLTQSGHGRDNCSLASIIAFVSGGRSLRVGLDHVCLVFEIAGHLVQQRKRARTVDRSGKRSIAAGFIPEGFGGGRHGPVTALS